MPVFQGSQAVRGTRALLPRTQQKFRGMQAKVLQGTAVGKLHRDGKVHLRYLQRDVEGRMCYFGTNTSLNSSFQMYLSPCSCGKEVLQALASES